MKRIKSPPIRRTLTGHELADMKKMDVYEPVTDFDQANEQALTNENEQTVTQSVPEVTETVQLVEDQVAHKLDNQETQPLEHSETPNDAEKTEMLSLESTGEKIAHVNDRRPFWGSFKSEKQKSSVTTMHQTQLITADQAERSISMNPETTNKSEKSNAIISETMSIKGDVELQTSLYVAGKIIGNVNCEALLETKPGSLIEGNVKANLANLLGGQVKGNVTCNENLTLEESTVVQGDIVALTILISGTVTGNVTAQGSVTLTKTAAVHGNLTSASISVESGATLEGQYTVRKNAD